MYTADGQWCEVLGEFGDGLLIRRTWMDSGDHEVEGALEIVPSVYETAPTKKWDNRLDSLRMEITREQGKIAELRGERVALETARKDLKELGTTLAHLDVMRTINRLTSGMVSHWVLLNPWHGVDIRETARMVCEDDRKTLKMMTIRVNHAGMVSVAANQYRDGSSEQDVDVIPCLSLEEAVTVASAELAKACVRWGGVISIGDRYIATASRLGLTLPDGFEALVAAQKDAAKDARIEKLRKELKDLEG